jgi:hypothetical protein
VAVGTPARHIHSGDNRRWASMKPGAAASGDEGDFRTTPNSGAIVIA